MSLLEAKQLFCERFSDIIPLDDSNTLPIVSVFIYHVKYKSEAQIFGQIESLSKV